MSDAQPIDPKDLHLYVATPTMHMSPIYVDSVERLTMKFSGLGMRLTLERETGDGIVRTRNRMTANFLKMGATHMLCIDDDVGFEAEAVVGMIRSQLDIVAGAYPKKSIDWNAVVAAVKRGVPTEELARHASPLCMNLIPDRPLSVISDPSEPQWRFIECLDAPTGFMMIRRQAIEKIISYYGDAIAYTADYEGHRGDRHHFIFHMDRDPTDDSPSGRYLSEDWWLCRQWQRMGGKVYLLAEARLRHHGAFIFEGCLADRLEKTEDDLPVELVVG